MDVEVVSPAKPVVSLKAKSVLLPGVSGYIEVLPGHADLVFALDIGRAVIRPEDNRPALSYFISGGYTHILNGKVTVLADEIDLVGDLDPTSIEIARQKAIEKLAQAKSGEEVTQALQEIKKADVSLEYIRSEKA